MRRKRIRRFLERLSCGLHAARALRALCLEIRSLPAIARCVAARIFSPDETLVICAWVKFRKGKLRPQNWGDDINVPLLEKATGRHVFVYPNTYVARFFALRNIVAIGSILCNIPNRNSIVWGSGIGNDKFDLKLRTRPQKILAVRGPLTRAWLLKRGIPCPEVYGDPALILPFVYSPQKRHQKKIGLIPHLEDWDQNRELIRTLETEDVRVVHMGNYSCWTDIIDEITSCDVICSSSLHGLIVAEAYKIPAIWIKFKEKKAGWDFKYYDFYAAVGRHVDGAFFVRNEKDLLSAATKVLKDWTPIKFDLTPLLKNAPVKFRFLKFKQQK